jgi:hypothetical protein
VGATQATADASMRSAPRAGVPVYGTTATLIPARVLEGRSRKIGIGVQMGATDAMADARTRIALRAGVPVGMRVKLRDAALGAWRRAVVTYTTGASCTRHMAHEIAVHNSRRMHFASTA